MFSILAHPTCIGRERYEYEAMTQDEPNGEDLLEAAARTAGAAAADVGHRKEPAGAPAVAGGTGVARAAAATARPAKMLPLPPRTASSIALHDPETAPNQRKSTPINVNQGIHPKALQCRRSQSPIAGVDPDEVAMIKLGSAALQV